MISKSLVGSSSIKFQDFQKRLCSKLNFFLTWKFTHLFLMQFSPNTKIFKEMKHLPLHSNRPYLQIPSGAWSWEIPSSSENLPCINGFSNDLLNEHFPLLQHQLLFSSSNLKWSCSKKAYTSIRLNRNTSSIRLKSSSKILRKVDFPAPFAPITP